MPIIDFSIHSSFTNAICTSKDVQNVINKIPENT